MPEFNIPLTITHVKFYSIHKEYKVEASNQEDAEVEAMKLAKKLTIKEIDETPTTMNLQDDGIYYAVEGEEEHVMRLEQIEQPQGITVFGFVDREVH